nr:Krueppel-like factor 16 [Aegilops tauschii subsp. strangulata]
MEGADRGREDEMHLAAATPQGRPHTSDRGPMPPRPPRDRGRRLTSSGRNGPPPGPPDALRPGPPPQMLRPSTLCGASRSPAATFIGVERTPAHTSGSGGGEGEGRRRGAAAAVRVSPSRLGGDDAGTGGSRNASVLITT